MDCLLFWNLQMTKRSASRSRGNEQGNHQICTLLGVMSSNFASARRSSVEGNAVRLYVSVKILSWAASARFRFFLIVGSSDVVGDKGGGLYDVG